MLMYTGILQRPAIMAPPVFVHLLPTVPNVFPTVLDSIVGVFAGGCCTSVLTSSNTCETNTINGPEIAEHVVQGIRRRDTGRWLWLKQRHANASFP